MNKKLLISCFALLGFGAAWAQPDSVYLSLSDALQHPENVYRLKIDGTELTELPADITKLTHLEWLDISSNNFKTFPMVVCRLTSLKTLWFAGAYSYMDQYEREEFLLDSIPDELGNLVNLENLDLSYHALVDLGNGFQKLKKLKVLNVYHAGLNAAPELEKICSLTALELLDIGGNDILKLPASFVQLKNMVRLNIDNSWSEGCPVGENLEAFPIEVCQLPNLEMLSLSGQNIKTLPAEIGNLKKLKELYLYANAFMKLPNEICNLTNLVNLQIDLLCLGNMLSLCDKTLKLPKKFCQLTQLTTFGYEGRKLSKSQEDMLKKCMPNLNKTME